MSQLLQRGNRWVTPEEAIRMQEADEKETQEAVALQAAADESNQDASSPEGEINHVVTQEDLDLNPGLEGELSVGDEIQIPVSDEEVTTPGVVSDEVIPGEDDLDESTNNDTQDEVVPTDAE